jgi:hypothetical protein
MMSGESSETLRKLQDFRVSGACSDRVHCIDGKPGFMFRRALLPLIAAALAAGLTASPAAAQRGDSPFSSQWDRPREERAPQRDVPLSDVLRDLRSRYGGQHLDARKVGEYYIIAWMTTDGRRLNIRVNAATGREE